MTTSPATGDQVPAAAPGTALPTSHRRGLVLLTAAGVLWGSIGLVVRLLEDRGNSAIAVAFWRLVCAGLVLLPIMGPARLRELGRQARRSGRLAAVALGSLAFQLLYFLAVRDVGVAVATLIALGLAPVAITAAESLSARTRPATRTLLVLLLALTGLVLVTAVGSSSLLVAPRPLLGVIEAILSGLMYAASTSWSAPLSNRLEPISIIFATTVAGIVVLLPVVAFAGWHVPQTSAAVSGTIWLGLVTTVIAYGLFYSGLRSTPGSIAMIVTLLEPVVAVFLAALFLHEPLTIANVVGGTLLLAAVVALYLKPRARSAVLEQ
jgi:DME family drug/metabolite transporter